MGPAVARIARALGVRLSRRSTKTGPQWNGKTMATIGRDGATPISDSNLIHELAHWFVSAPERRPQVNFGLGPSPEDVLENLGSPKWAVEEECLASSLGIEMEFVLGMDAEKTMKSHGWEDPWHCEEWVRAASIRVEPDGVPRRVSPCRV